MTITPQALTIREFCATYRVGRSYTYDQISAGRLRVVKAGRRTLVPVDAAREWFESLRQVGHASAA